MHSTVDMDGNVRFGPDVEWVREIDYVVRVLARVFDDAMCILLPCIACQVDR